MKNIDTYCDQIDGLLNLKIQVKEQVLNLRKLIEQAEAVDFDLPQEVYEATQELSDLPKEVHEEIKLTVKEMQKFLKETSV